MSTPVKPDITPYLEAIENAVYGEEVRGSIHDAIEAVNNYADEFYTDAQEQAQAAANSASDASGYATTASNKAGEASASATAAGNAETAAKNAKTDAVDAKNLANEYAGNAASSAAQAAASAQAAAAAGPILVDTVGWMCKNRVPLTLDSLKALNTLGTWADNVYTRNDVAFTVNTNSDGYVTSIVMNGTASGFASLTLLDDTIANLSEILPQGNYIVNGCPDGGAMLSGYSMRFKVDTETYYITDSDDMTVAVSGSSSYQVTWSLACTSGTSVSSKTFKPMIRKAAIIDNSFESYHKSVEDWYWENNAKTGVHNRINVYDVKQNYHTTSNITDKGKNMRVVSSEAGTYSSYSCYMNDLDLNTDYVLKGHANITSGTAALKVQKTDNTQIAITSSITESGDLELRFNSGNNAQLVAVFFVTWNQSTSGDITYENTMLLDAADTCEDFSDYAMPNTVLTEKALMKGLLLTSSDDLDDIKTTGIYAITTPPANSPDSVSYCTLIVNGVAPSGYRQIIIRDQNIYVRRYGGSPATWSSWYKFTGTVVS